jgi:D-beta-D-heptose 7-phosphate kinase/D-beta-D-heptose 1-phosphate adenosyltransferase
MTSSSALAAAVKKLKGARIVCVGDVMLDKFIYGDVERISPEAPIPVFRTRRQVAMLGGAGNVLRNAVGLGAEVCFISVTGGGEAGQEVTDLINGLDGVDVRLSADDTRKTSLKTRYIASGQQMMRADDETIKPLDKGLRAALLLAAEDALENAGAMVLSDYGKGILAAGLARELIDLAIAQGVPVVVDPQGSDYSAYRGASLVTPNRRELADATGMATINENDIIAAGVELINEHGIQRVLATRSADGMTLISGPDDVRHFTAETKEVFDVSGAGDTVVATLATAIAAGLSLSQAVELANVAAGIVVGKVGTAVAFAADIIDALHTGHNANGAAKVMSRDAALDRIALWRSQGLKVGLASGCFDLLHPGHLSTFSQAKAACDRLIIGLNSDASTKRLKGDGRPVQNEDARAAVIAALEDVDGVVVFNEDTPEALIETLKPDVFVKGADYAIDDLPEAKIVQSYGGEIVLAELADGHSTSGTIERMGNKPKN